MTKPRRSKKPNNNYNSKKVPYILPETEKNQAVGRVTNIMGDGRFMVNAFDGKSVLRNVNCSVPGKFKGRNKRRNFITAGSYVLITYGIRTSRDGAKQMGEIIHIYPRQHVKQLRMDNMVVEGIDDRDDQNDDSRVSFETDDDLAEGISIDDL